jgi:outer membrane beta-barrel protein
MAMNQARVGLLVAAVLVAMPATAMAQPKGAAAKAAAAKAAAAKKDAGKAIDLDADKPAAAAAGAAAAGATDVPADTPAGPAGPAGGPEDTGGLGDICKIDPTACPTIDLDKAAARDMHEQMYAVQQIYALRYHRFEVNPYFGLTLNDQFVSHDGPGLALNFYLTNVVAVGVNGNFYQGLNSTSAFNLQTSLAARIGEPINEYQWSASANITYVPAYGKFAGFGDFIFHYDIFLHAGAGAISTRPEAVIDPDNRTFNFTPKPMGQIGGGIRIFFNRWLAAVLEVSDYIYPEKLENPQIANGVGTGAGTAQDSTTWLDPGTYVTNNVQAQLGLSFFLPFTWEYKLPK